MNLSSVLIRCGTALVCLALSLVSGAAEPKRNDAAKAPLTLIVTDPLSRELACACVRGYGQRDYRKVSARLSSALNEKVNIEFSDDLVETLELIGGVNREYLVIGDRSLVAHTSKKAGLKCEPLCALTDRDGNTDLAATFVIRSDDPAKELKDIAGRKLLVGLAELDQKLVAAMAALSSAGVKGPKPEKHLSFNDAALDLLDSEASPLPVAVLPSYALPLLQGCGSVKPGNLKILAKSEATPFITMFISENIEAKKREKILATLLGIKNDAALLDAMESKEGFKAITPGAASKLNAASSWSDWRGAQRDGRVPRLPAKLRSTPEVVWKKAAVVGGLAGLSVSDGRVLMAERDIEDRKDVYRCFDAESGELAWRVSYPAPGNLDYGNAPRAAPVIRDGRAYLLGAFGDLRCLEMTEGKLIWERQLVREFGARLPTWGMCSPPLLVDEVLIVNPGAPNASLAALDLSTGKTRWTVPGGPAAYSAFIVGVFGGQRQVIGYDQHSVGGWDPKSGARLWQLVPPTASDFNVPTPLAVDGGIVLSTENNGTRFYRFAEGGKIMAEPSARFADLAPDTATPVMTRGRIFGASHERLYCLDAETLKPIWRRDENNLGDHASFIADDDRVLVITIRGELILLDGASNDFSVLSRTKLFEEDVEVYAHPALVGSRLYARGGETLICVDIASN